MAQATPVEAKAKVRESKACPPWSAVSTCIIPAVTAAVKNTTFVMSETTGQTPLESRAVRSGDTCTRTFSSLTFGSVVVFGARSFAGTRGASLGECSFGERASDSDSDVPDDSSESGCDGGGSGNSSSA
eukprot:4929127-Pleurochrysis_carterae.AAC.1